MKKEYMYDITPTASGDFWTVEVMHDGKYVAEMRKFFKHQYTGKAPNRKIVKLARFRAEEYITELEAAGYVLHERHAREIESLRKIFPNGGNGND